MEIIMHSTENTPANPEKRRGVLSGIRKTVLSLGREKGVEITIDEARRLLKEMEAIYEDHDKANTEGNDIVPYNTGEDRSVIISLQGVIKKAEEKGETKANGETKVHITKNDHEWMGIYR